MTWPTVRRLVERVKRCAARRPLLVCTDGLVSYIRAIRETFAILTHGQRWATAAAPWRNVLIAQGSSATSGAVSSRPTAALSTARPPVVDARQRSQGNGVINTAYIERLNATFRERLAPLARRCRALARQTLTLHEGMFLLGRSITFARLTRVSTPPRRQRQPWLESPIIAGRCTNCCHCTYRRVGHHPSNVGGPRICSNVLLSGGGETTIAVELSLSIVS